MTGFNKKACRKCAMCGKSFIAKVNNQKYCSEPCRRQADGKNSGDESWRKGRYCVVCGKFFYPKSSRQKTCGFTCSEENGRRLQARFRRRKAGVLVDDIEIEEDTSSEYGPELDEYSRKCHDCGRPTNDYRCAACRRKWRVKNKVG